MDEHVIGTYVRAPEVFVEGQGALLRDSDGHEWLDFLGGIAVSALGHAHPKLTEALRDQVGKVLHVSNLYRHTYTDSVADKLCALSGMRAVFFTNSGTEANEAALKLARKHQRRHDRGHRTGFVALDGGFHGRTMGALSVTSGAKYREPFAPLIEGCTWIAPDDVEALAKALATEPAALILEPIQGEGGIRPLADDFLRTARELCSQTDTVLIHDEIQCGTGRTGRFLCSDHAGTKPDVVTLAKPLAAGLPMGAMLVADGLHDTLVPGDHGSTFAGGPLVCRAALVLLEELENGLMDACTGRGAQLRAGLEALQRDFPQIREVRGRGLMQALVLHERAPDLQKTLYGNRLITNCTAGDVVRFLPPYVVTKAQVDDALAIVERSLRTVFEPSR